MTALDPNPYALGTATAAEAIPADRAAFLRRTYSLLLTGVVGFAATMWAAGTIPAAQELMVSLWRLVSSGFVGILLYFGIFWGGAMAVHAFAERKPLNLVLFYAYSVVMGLLVAPIALYAAETSPDVLLEAAVTTVVVFSALTGYVFFTKKDFSFLRGTLTVMFFVLLLGPLLGMLFGFDLTLLFSIGIVLFFVLYILYDTSAILRRYPTTMHVSAACVLFVDIVMLFKQLLFLLLSRDD